MNLLRYTVHSPVVNTVLGITPLKCLPVEICYVVEYPVNEEILFHKTDKPLHFPFGKRMARLTELCVETHHAHKRFVILLPNGMSLQVAVEDNALHVVCQHVFGNAHVLESVDHPNE